MSKLPADLSGRDVVKVFFKFGYDVDHQTGSHIILRQKISPFRRLTIPDHKVLAKGTLRAIIREAGLTKEEFVSMSG